MQLQQLGLEICVSDMGITTAWFISSRQSVSDTSYNVC